MARRVFNRFKRFIAKQAPPMLKRAHQLMGQGDYPNATLAFYELAKKAEQNFPQHAPMLYIQAGRAAMLSGEQTKAMTHFRSGITLFGTQNRFARLEKIGNIIIAELRGRGLNAEANEIQEVIKNNLPSNTQREILPTGKNIVLPTHCPACGAIIRPNEVEWLDEITAACDYCGSPIRKSPHR